MTVPAVGEWAEDPGGENRIGEFIPTENPAQK